MTGPEQELAQRIGERVRFLRTQSPLALSQEKLAERAELTSVYIGQVERAEKRVTVVALARIVSALDLRLSEFFAGIGT